MSENCIFKKFDRPCEKVKDSFLVLAQRNNMITLNETAYFIWSNCDGKTVCEIAKTLYSVCLNKDEITYDEILPDINATLKNLISVGLVTIN